MKSLKVVYRVWQEKENEYSDDKVAVYSIPKYFHTWDRADIESIVLENMDLGEDDEIVDTIWTTAQAPLEIPQSIVDEIKWAIRRENGIKVVNDRKYAVIAKKW